MLSIDNNHPHIIAVSGGPDSIFLLDNVVKQGIKNIVVAHVNYNFRSDSWNDENIVKNFCLANNLQLEILNTNYNKETKENFESWARNTRYNFFVEVGNKYNIDNVIIGHNQNDLIETYLIQKQRNNIVNHYGLQSKLKYKDLIIFRPMLDIKRSEIIEYLTRNNIDYALDSTNDDEKYLRNSIRKKINENDFKNYLIEIKEENKVLNSNKEEALKIFNKNKNLITKETRQLSNKILKHYIIIFFTYWKQEKLIINSDNRILDEIIRRIKTSDKSYWEINFKSQTLLQNFNKLYFLSNKNIEPKTFIVNDICDIEQLKIFNNFNELQQCVLNNKDKLPLMVSNDFKMYKQETKYNNKTTNRYFIEKKISYVWRYLNGVVWSTSEGLILNKIY